MRKYFTELTTIRRVFSRFAVIALSLLLCVSLVACGAKSNEPKSFSVGGMTITLTAEFKEMKSNQYTASYDSGEVSVMVIKEKFTTLGKLAGCTLEEYAQLALETNRPDDPLTLQRKDGLTYFEYEYFYAENEEAYTYLIVLHKSSDAFWVVQFVTLSENMTEYRSQIFEWAKSVSFAE